MEGKAASAAFFVFLAAFAGGSGCGEFLFNQLVDNKMPLHIFN
ncbi:hypothetical protein ACHMW9_14450 [Mesorhizobium terrae]|jgi:hypothetical protein